MFVENTEHKCAVCRKKFSTFCFPKWEYRTKCRGYKKWFCGYNCMREWQRTHERQETPQGVEQKKLKELIKSKGMNARVFAEKVGLTESMVSYILSGKKRLMEWHKDNFARALGISKEELEKNLEA